MQHLRGRIGSADMPIAKLNRESMPLEPVPELGPCVVACCERAVGGRSAGGQRAVSGRLLPRVVENQGISAG